MECRRSTRTAIPSLPSLQGFVLAHRYRTDRVLTLDTRHFRALGTIRGRPFTILPEDDIV